MGEARVPRLSAEEATAVAEAEGLPAVMADYNVFRVLLKQPKLAKAMSRLLGVLMQSTLDDRLRELVIMRIGWVTGADYEWTQHWRVATGLGVSESDLAGVRDWKTYDGFGPADRAVLQATDDVIERGAISADTWNACVAHIDGGEQALIDLVVAIGNWRMYSSLLRSLEVPLEDDLSSWPPDGRAPF
jgi:alkylhydroperoxidase family enzyme